MGYRKIPSKRHRAFADRVVHACRLRRCQRRLGNTICRLSRYCQPIRLRNVLAIALHFMERLEVCDVQRRGCCGGEENDWFYLWNGRSDGAELHMVQWSCGIVVKTGLACFAVRTCKGGRRLHQDCIGRRTLIITGSSMLGVIVESCSPDEQIVYSSYYVMNHTLMT